MIERAEGDGPSGKPFLTLSSHHDDVDVGPLHFVQFLEFGPADTEIEKDQPDIWKHPGRRGMSRLGRPSRPNSRDWSRIASADE